MPIIGNGLKTLGGLGSGGSLLPLSIDFSTLPDGASFAPLTGATWAIASGKIANTPTEGASTITDGGLEAWTSSTNLTNWTESVAGTSTVNQETVSVHGGSNAARLDTDASASLVSIAQTPSGVALGNWLKTTLWARSNPAAAAIQQNVNNQRNATFSITLTGTYAEYQHNVIVSNLTISEVINRFAGQASKSFYIDDIAQVILDTPTIFNTANAGQANVIVKGGWTMPASGSTLAGVVLNLDSQVNPQNYVVFLINGSSNNSYLIKVVAGVVTQVATTAITYSATANVELRKVDATTYQMYYNSVKVGADQTISDATIINNTYHGLA